ncbi:phage portal protein [Streptomyces sp. NBC_01451]|uniref:phage portal protein n=1 Tax=Streptomyces sp. NBC_01451 TaxID=2903872 RepID=UPI002E32ECA6|nr:phage portal protein [Streptomyces sp. NBC_01451]
MGHHWAYKREAGEPSITINYVGALSRYITNFTFGRGIHFQSEKKYEHVVPALLDRAWNVDNDKKSLLWQMGENGGVSGDCFVKVAYEPAWTDPAGNLHPGRVRILPLNSAQCFPEYHPHDRDRLLRWKTKYKFWGTSLEGTRAVYTYTEIITDDYIEEYVNDELLDARENPLGQIPIVHIRNISVSGSPWGLADIVDVIPLNREFNEKATEISDIVNYHSAPVTILLGAKASNLEKGPRKIWGGLPKDAQVFNLENGVDLAGPLAYLDLIKRSMHELTGVPESALGQAQAISNTSGVALSIQFFPLMQRYSLKQTNYTDGLRRINELILRTLFLYEPETRVYNPDTQGIRTSEQQPLVIDPRDPSVYDTTCDWPPPLPVDELVKLNEVQAKLALGLESKRGALRDLGETFLDEKMQEIFDERLAEAKEDGALEFIKAQIASAILRTTGLPPTGVESPPPAPAGGSSSDSKSGATSAGPLPGLPGTGSGQDIESVLSELVTLSKGTKLAQRRNPEND